MLPGKGSVVGERFVTHPAVRKVCFTGSTEVGKRIMAGCAEQVKRVTLELGGKSANIVFADADLAKAAAAAPAAAFDNAGQDCCARSRHAGAAPGVRPVPGAAGGRRSPRSGSTDPARRRRRDGPAHLGRAARRPWRPMWTTPRSRSAGPRRTARDSGTRRRCCSRRRRGTGTGARRSSARCSRCCRFDDEAEAVRLANDTEYGLSGSIWTRDLGRAIRVSRGVETGNLSVNSNSSVRYWTPFGGVKQSGLGRELGPDAVAAFTEVKNVFFSSE